MRVILVGLHPMVMLLRSAVTQLSILTVFIALAVAGPTAFRGEVLKAPATNDGVKSRKAEANFLCFVAAGAAREAGITTLFVVVIQTDSAVADGAELDVNGVCLWRAAAAIWAGQRPMQSDPVASNALKPVRLLVTNLAIDPCHIEKGPKVDAGVFHAYALGHWC